MHHDKELFKLKKRVRYYDKQSFVYELDKVLSRHPDGSIEKQKQMPSLVYLLLEWVLEVENSGIPKTTSPNDILWFLNRLWQLINSAGSNRQTESLTLFLRPLINNQFWLQHSREYWLRSLVLQHAIMFPGGQSPFNDEFYQVTKIRLSDFFHIVIIIFLGMDTHFRSMKYFEVIKALHPYFSLEIIARAIRLFALYPQEISSFLIDRLPRDDTLNFINAETRLLHCPIILNTQGLYTLDHALVRRGLAESALNHFLRLNRDGFRKRYGEAYESFVRRCLERSDISFCSENELELLYKAHKVSGKVVDALVTSEQGVVFIEAKSVVPKVDTLVTADPRTIKHHLKDSVLKAGKQIIECAYRLEKECNFQLPAYADRFGLIITQGEYYLKRFSDVSMHVAADTMLNMESNYGRPIPYENIFICNINDFDYFLSANVTCDDFLVSFMRHCKEEDADMSLMHTPEQSGHRFRHYPDTLSVLIRTPIPG